MPTELDLLTDEYLQETADCLRVMAHPMRLKMVMVLIQGRYSVGQIAELCGCSPNQTCEHLRLMQGHGYLSSRREGRTVYYEIRSPRLPSLIRCIRNNCNAK